MKNTFTTADFQLDLSSIALSIQEENLFFKDGLSTKFTFPFTAVISPELRRVLGDISHVASVVENRFEGIFTFEGKAYKAHLEIVSASGDTFQGQIDYGFEDFPLLNEKLADVLTGFSSDTDARCDFPTLLYEKYKDKDYFEAFSHQINAFNSENGQKELVLNDYDTYISSNEVQTNVGEAKMRTRNRNIIQPMPNLLYVLEKGFAQKGYTLKGDILKDFTLSNALIYKPLQHYTFNDLPEITIEIDPNGEEWQTFEAVMPPGYYIIVNWKDWKKIQFIHKASGTVNPFVKDFQTGAYGHSSHITVFEFDTYYQDNTFLIKVNKNIPKAFQPLTIKGYLNDYFYDAKYYHTYPLLSFVRKWEMKALVPDMTFAELLGILKTFFGYTYEIKGDEVHFNKPNLSNIAFHDKSYTAVENPEISFAEKNTFLYTFPKAEKDTLPSVYIDNQGVRLVAKNPPTENTTEMKLHFFPYKNKLQEVNTENTSILILVNPSSIIHFDTCPYDTRYAQKMHPYHMMENIQSFRLKELKNKQLRWSFIDKRALWQNVSASDSIFAFGQRILIKSLSKTILNDDFCQIEITGVIL